MISFDLSTDTAPPSRLSRLTLTGAGFILLAPATLLTFALRDFLWRIQVTGWDIIICTVLLVSGVQLLCLGILGQYLTKAYKEVKHRPHYIIARSGSSSDHLPQNTHAEECAK